MLEEFATTYFFFHLPAACLIIFNVCFSNAFRRRNEFNALLVHLYNLFVGYTLKTPVITWLCGFLIFRWWWWAAYNEWLFPPGKPHHSTRYGLGKPLFSLEFKHTFSYRGHCKYFYFTKQQVQWIKFNIYITDNILWNIIPLRFSKKMTNQR